MNGTELRSFIHYQILTLFANKQSYTQLDSRKRDTAF